MHHYYIQEALTALAACERIKPALTCPSLLYLPECLRKPDSTLAMVLGTQSLDFWHPGSCLLGVPNSASKGGPKRSGAENSFRCTVGASKCTLSCT